MSIENGKALIKRHNNVNMKYIFLQQKPIIDTRQQLKIFFNLFFLVFDDEPTNSPQNKTKKKC